MIDKNAVISLGHRTNGIESVEYLLNYFILCKYYPFKYIKGKQQKTNRKVKKIQELLSGSCGIQRDIYHPLF